MKPLFIFFGRDAGPLPSAQTTGFRRAPLCAFSSAKRTYSSRKWFGFLGGVPSAVEGLLPNAGLSLSVPYAISVFTLALSVSANAQEQPRDSVKPLDEVQVSAIRATTKTPVSYTNLNKEQIAPRNLGQDIPTLMNFMPSVVTTSDAGNGIGYSGIRVRGSDATRINVTLNGIPYNDSESHGTFWVNMPDFASSVQNLQLQRGVGTSTNGAGAFGASLNLLTDSYSEKPFAEISNSVGSFNSRKHTVRFSSGLLGNHFELGGRVSNVASDGYIDRASSTLRSYFLQANYIDRGTLIKALVFGGSQKTYQAWYGLEDPEKLGNDRTYNPAGEYIDDNGVTRFYDNQTDNYWQDHYQLHWNQQWSGNWKTHFALHWTPGKGYYENYEVGETVVLNGVESETDAITQKWLDNDFYGTVFSASYRKNGLDVILGGGWNEYDGDHYGKILWTRSVLLPEYGYRYYEDDAVKKDMNAYAKANYQLDDRWNLFADLQLRRVTYDANSAETGWVHDRFNFFNPKAGVTFTASKNHNIYFSFARANREPNRTDYENGSPRPEQLDDFELGWRFSGRAKINVNAYYMRYHDQLVLTGALDEVGNPIRENSGNSYRLGIEAEAVVPLGAKWTWRPNITLSRNRNEDFVFQRDGILTNLGDTEIAFSPSVVAANMISFTPAEGFTAGLLSKYVGKQYMGNIDSDVSRLDAYFVNDLSISYRFVPKAIFKSVTANLLVNNILDHEYESNGYFYTYDDDFTTPGTVVTMEGAGFYPQAGTNFLLGLTLLF